MPIYEYYCPKCDREFELMRPLSQCDFPGFCPCCGERGEKLISCCASKVDFYIRPPSKAPFRARSKTTNN